MESKSLTSLKDALRQIPTTTLEWDPKMALMLPNVPSGTFF